MVGTQTRAEVVEEMAPAENQSSVALWAPKANPRAPRADPQCLMVGEMAPKANQSSVAQWAPKANPRAPKANPLCVLLCLFAGLAPKANQTH